MLPVAHGYEIPYKPSKHYIPADEMKETSLKCNAIPTKKEVGDHHYPRLVPMKT